jgi:hypothetical protein
LVQSKRNEALTAGLVRIRSQRSRNSDRLRGRGEDLEAFLSAESVRISQVGRGSAGATATKPNPVRSTIEVPALVSPRGSSGPCTLARWRTTLPAPSHAPRGWQQARPGGPFPHRVGPSTYGSAGARPQAPDLLEVDCELRRSVTQRYWWCRFCQAKAGFLELHLRLFRRTNHSIIHPARTLLDTSRWTMVRIVAASTLLTFVGVLRRRLTPVTTRQLSCPVGLPSITGPAGGPGDLRGACRLSGP